MDERTEGQTNGQNKLYIIIYLKFYVVVGVQFVPGGWLGVVCNMAGPLFVFRRRGQIYLLIKKL